MAAGEMISHVQMDALQEISNIGLGNAATALADLLNKRVEIDVPKARFLDFEEVYALTGGIEEVVSCANLGLEGDISGAVMFVFSEQSTYNLIDMLMGYELGTTSALDDLGISAIAEIGNVLTGSFINAIGCMTGLKMITTVPMFAFDMLGAVLSASFVAGGNWGDKILVIETFFLQNHGQIKGHFFLLPETGALNRLFEALGMPVES